MAEISIVLPVYNGEKYLARSIESVINQSFRDWELIIVNDCSTDSSKHIMEKYAEKDERITIINNDINQKLPKSLNIGFRKANGKYLTWTSDDNRYRELALEKMIMYLESHKKSAMVKADMTIVDDNENVISTTKSYEDKQMYINNQVGACFLYRREVYEKIGEYDSDMFLVEDYEYWLRVLMTYGHIDYIPEDLYIYLHHNHSLSVDRRKEVIEQRYKLYNKYKEFFFKGLIDNDLMYDFSHIYKSMELQNMLDEGERRKYQKSILPLMNELVDYTKHKKIGVYGAGIKGKQFVIENKNVVAVIDSDIKKWGSLVSDKIVVSIEDYCEKYGNMPVVIAVTNRKKQLEIMQLLKSYNLKYSLWDIFQ